MIWRRKHVCDLADVCRRYAADTRVGDGARTMFADLYETARICSKHVTGTSDTRTVDLVTRLCAACQTGSLTTDCAGRIDWQDECSLIRGHTTDTPER